MPHARIIAESPERAQILARQLEERGYTVEIVAPGAQVNTPADLEITATDEVFAAPGSILGLMEYEPDEKPAPEYYLLDDQPPSAGASLREVLAQTRQAFAGGWQAIAGPLGARLSGYRAERAQRLEAQRAEREQRRAHAERVRAEQAEVARLARIAAEQERERARAERAEAERLARIAAEEDARRRSEATENARLAEIAAEKEQARRRAIELERERSLRAARTAQQEEARRLAAYEQELIRRAAEDRRRRDAERRREREAVRLARLEMRTPAPIPAEPPQVRRWKAAFAAAAAVSALAVLGLFFAQRQPAAPVSNQTVLESEALEQQVPFGGATALPAEAVLEKAANPAPSLTDAPPPRPQQRRVFRVDADSAAFDEGGPEVIIRRAKRPPRAGERASEIRRITDDEFDEEELE